MWWSFGRGSKRAAARLGYRGEEPAAWIWWDLGSDKKAMAVRLEGFHLSVRSMEMVTGVEELRAPLDLSLRSRRTMGAC